VEKREATEKVITPLISVPDRASVLSKSRFGGRFPREKNKVHSSLDTSSISVAAGLSDCVVSAGVAALHFNQLEYSLRISFSVASKKGGAGWL